MNDRNRVFAVVIVVVLVVVGIAVTGTSESAPAVPALGPRLAAAGEDTTWYCAEGTANAGGRADEQLAIGNVDRRPMNAVVTIDGGSDVPPVVRGYAVPPGRVVRVRVGDLAPIADPGVVVETTGGRGVVEHTLSRAGETAMGPCAREPRDVTRFAAGTTSKGSELWLALFNPFPDDAIVDVEAITDGGRRAPGNLQGIVVPHLTRVAVPIHSSIQRVDTVATQVTVRRGRVVAEQSQYLDGSDGRKGLALSEGAELAKQWRFPLAVAGTGRQQRFVLVNPGTSDVTVQISFTLAAAAAVEPLSLTVPATSVVTPTLDRVPDDIPYTATMRASRPFLVEGIGAVGAPRPAARRGIATDPGFTTSARTWAVVPARLSATSSDALGVVSADGRAHRVRVVLPERSGPRTLLTADVPATGRAVIDVARVTDLPDLALLLLVDGPVVVERESNVPGFTRSHAVAG